MYDLSQIGTGTLFGDFNEWMAKFSKNPTDMRRFDQKKGIHWALEEVNIDVFAGEVLGIIGRNGAGKSTLLKVLSRITSPNSGKVKVKGRIASLLEVGTGFHMELTGRENVFLNGAILGMRKHEISARLDEIVAFAGVEKFFDSPVKRYSSGMLMKLAFSVAAHLEPEILVVDEVLAVGDVEFQRKCIGKMKQVSEQKGRTILFVSHNMGAIEMLCSRVVLLEKGTVAYDGNTCEGVNKYLEKNEVLASLELAERKDRRGSQKIHVRKIMLFDMQGREIYQVHSGQSFSIHFVYHINEHIPMPEMLNFCLDISSKEDYKLIQHHTRLTRTSLSDYRNNDTVVFAIQDLPLVEGEYNISYCILLDNIFLDGLENAFVLKVERGDFFNYREMPLYSHGKMLIKGDWSLRK